MKYRIRMLRRAHADFASTVAYLYERSPQGAAVWVNAFEKAKNRLAEYADSCSEADENYRFDIDVKQLLFKTRRGRVYRLILPSPRMRSASFECVAPVRRELNR